MMETTTGSTIPTQDERNLAAAAHLSVIIPYFSIFAPLIIWAVKKDKSPFVAYQAMQATAYQIAIMGVSMAGFFCLSILTLLFLFGGMVSLPLTALFEEFILLVIGFMFTAPVLLPVVMSIFLLGWIFSILYGIIGGVMAYKGRNFQYAFVTSFVERHVQSPPRLP